MTCGLPRRRGRGRGRVGSPASPCACHTATCARWAAPGPPSLQSRRWATAGRRPQRASSCAPAGAGRAMSARGRGRFDPNISRVLCPPCAGVVCTTALLPTISTGVCVCLCSLSRQVRRFSFAWLDLSGCQHVSCCPMRMPIDRFLKSTLG